MRADRRAVDRRVGRRDMNSLIAHRDEQDSRVASLRVNVSPREEPEVEMFGGN